MSRNGVVGPVPAVFGSAVTDGQPANDAAANDAAANDAAANDAAANGAAANGEGLRTARLILRPLTAGDGGWLAALHGDAAVMRYIDDGRPVPAEVTAHQALPAILAEYGRFAAGLG